MFRRFCWAALACAAAVTSARAEGPDELATYHASVRQVLKEAFSKDVRARVIVEPSFSSEYAVGLRAQGQGYAIFSLEAASQMWGYSVARLMRQGQITAFSRDGKPQTAEIIRRIEAGLPPDPRMVQKIRCEAPVEPALGERVLRLWRRALEDDARWANHPGLDGETYDFWADTLTASPSRLIWSPRLDTVPGGLVTLSAALKHHCRTRSPESLQELRQAADSLERDLASAAPAKDAR